MSGKRPVGRPRQLDDQAERALILDAAYAALRDRGDDVTIANILTEAGVSTRSFYRHFPSKDALLCAMYRRDAEWAAAHLTKRLADATSPTEAVSWWIDEIFAFMGDARRAERVAVLGSIMGSRADGAAVVALEARQLLIEPLCVAVTAGIETGVFNVDVAMPAADMVAAVVLHAAGLGAPFRRDDVRDQAATTAFCLTALGVPR